jgi:hypothetical protein
VLPLAVLPDHASLILGTRQDTMEPRQLLVSAAAAAMVAAALGIGGPAQASSTSSALEPPALARAEAIRAEMNTRYRLLAGPGLAVTEATSTGVVESFVLLTPDLLETRIVPADNGIHFAICPRHANCPSPSPRVAVPAADLRPRRMALELALRTFLETSAEVVAVSLPTPRFTLFIVERNELAREVDLPSFSQALRADLLVPLAASLEEAIDRVTRPRVVVFAGLEPTSSGKDLWVGVRRWPALAREESDGPAPRQASRARRSLVFERVGYPSSRARACARGDA